MKTILHTRVGGTRWLPHISLAIGNFVKSYKAIRLHLESASNTSAKAEGYAKIAADANIIVYMLSLKEVVAPLVRLSFNLQKEGLTLADASIHVHATESVLKEQYTFECDSVKSVLTDGLYQGERVVFHGAQSKKNHVKEIAEGIVQHLHARFPSYAIVQASSVTNNQKWPTEQSEIQG